MAYATKKTDSEIFLDSSIWLAYLLAERNEVRSIVEFEGVVLTSALTIYEVKRKLMRLKLTNEKVQRALTFIKERSLVIEITDDLAQDAAELSHTKDLPAVDAMIYVSSQRHKAVLVTGDNDFKGLENVRILN